MQITIGSNRIFWIQQMIHQSNLHLTWMQKEVPIIFSCKLFFSNILSSLSSAEQAEVRQRSDSSSDFFSVYALLHGVKLSQSKYYNFFSAPCFLGPIKQETPWRNWH